MAAEMKIGLVVDDNGAVQKLNDVEAAIKGVEKSGAASATSAQSLGNSLKNVDSSLGQMKAPVGWGNIAKEVGAMGAAFDTVGKKLAGAGIVALLDQAISSALDFTSKLADMSAKTGASVADLQKMELAGSLVGVSMDQISSAISQMQNRLVGENPKAIDAMNRLGLSVGSILDADPGTAMTTLANAFGNISTQAERANISSGLFGKSGMAMLPMLTGELQHVGDVMERTGFLISQGAVDGGDALGDFSTIAVASLRRVAVEMLNLGRLGNDIANVKSFNLLFGGDNTPSVSAPDMFSGGKPVAPDRIDAKEQLQIENQLTTEYKRQLEERKRLAEEWQRVNDQMSGKAALDAANTAIKHMKDLGDVSKIADSQLASFTKTINEGAEALFHLGGAATPAAMELLSVWAGLQKANTIAPPIITEMGEETRRLMELQSWAQTQSPSQINPFPIIQNLSAATLAAATQTVSPFRTAFNKLGEDLPGIIFGALQHGGSVLGALAGALGAQFSGQFQDALKKAGGDMSKVSASNKALGLAGGAISAGITGYQLGQQLGKGKGALAGAGAGAAIGTSIMPGFGTAIGAGIGALAGFFGGRKKDKEAKAQMEEQRAEWIAQYGGMDKLKAMAADLGVNIDKAFSTKKPEEFKAVVESLNKALEKQKGLVEGVASITAGTNARSANIGTQGDLNTVSAGAVSSFGLQLGTGVSAVDALSALNPALVAMKDALAGGNFELNEAGTRLMGLAAIVEANRIPFQNLAADGQILSGMMQGNIRDFGLFQTVATDIGTSLQGMIDRGVPAAQVFALAQPQLQAIWEAQQKWHFEIDGTTQALVNQAAEQGFVGENMKSIQQQMLDATLGMRDAMVAIAVAMGALPSAAQSAANGMNDAFSKVKPPSLGGYTPPNVNPTGSEPTYDDYTGPTVDLGDTLGRDIERGEPSRGHSVIAGGNSPVILNIDGQTIARSIVKLIPGAVREFGLA